MSRQRLNGYAYSHKKKHIGKLIKEARKQKRLRADDVAVFCNVSRSRVYQWEAADSILPKNLKSLSVALRVPVGVLSAANKKNMSESNTIQYVH